MKFALDLILSEEIVELLFQAIYSFTLQGQHALFSELQEEHITTRYLWTTKTTGNAGESTKHGRRIQWLLIVERMWRRIKLALLETWKLSHFWTLAKCTCWKKTSMTLTETFNCVKKNKRTAWINKLLSGRNVISCIARRKIILHTINLL